MNLFRLSLTALVLMVCNHANGETMSPLYAAQASESFSAFCQTSASCSPNILSSSELRTQLNQNLYAEEVLNALSLSDYEVLIASAVIEVNEEAQLYMEFTTTWRGVPIDEILIHTAWESSKRHLKVEHLMADWVSHIQQAQVLDAEIIYRTIKASDYHKQLLLPAGIGDFSLQDRALYRDPMQGSIARYMHREYAEAVFDVSVYPISPFVHPQAQNDAQRLHEELAYEKAQILALIDAADIANFEISEIEPFSISVKQSQFQGLKLSVMLEHDGEPAYSTQYLLQQGDKFVKLTGNFPDQFMQALVSQTLPEIKVPPESPFMRSMRNG